MQKFDEIQLKNGLHIIGERIPHFRSASVGLWVRAGTQDELSREGGISHFLEHMMFKGTHKRTARQIAQTMDAVGGQINAFTSKECTCYYAKVIDENLSLAMDVLSDLLLNSVFASEEIEKEKGVVLEEIGMVEDSPEELVHDLIMEAYFAEQPLSKPILGTSQSVGSFDRSNLIDYWKRMYSPHNTVLAVAGNYDWSQVIEDAEKHLGQWSGSLDFPETRQTDGGNRLLRKEKPIEQLHICLGFPGVKLGHKQAYLLSILNTILGGSMSSRLFQKIREESGMAYSVYSYPSSYTAGGLLNIYAGTSKQHAEDVVKMLRSEIDGFVQYGVSIQEFEQARAQLKSSYILGQESSSSRMQSIGRRKLLLGTTKSEIQVLAEIESLSHKDAQNMIKQIFENDCAAAVVGNGAENLNLNSFHKNG